MPNIADRVRTRAYFLWEKRTGRRWWDPVSNWFEAKDRETGPKRALWPCTMHFDRVEPVIADSAGTWTETAIHRWQLSELEALRAAYRRACDATENADYICAFACGGAPLLMHACETESRQRFGAVSSLSDAQLELLQSRFHLFSGLSWGEGRSTAAVREFLDHVPDNARVLFLDCSFTGGAIAAIANVLTSHNAGPRCRIFGVVDENQLSQTKVAPAQDAARAGSLEALDFERVPNLLSEDFPALLGYDRLQSADPSIRGTWTAGAISIHEPTSNRYHVVSSIPLFAQYRSLLWEAAPTTFETAAKRHGDACADTTIFTLLHLVRSEHDRARAELAEANPYGLYQARRELCGRFTRDAIAIAHHFQIDRGEISRPEFCDELPREKQLFEGQIGAVELYEMDDEFIVSIRTAFRDELQRQRNDLSFTIPRTELSTARANNMTLEAVAGERLLDKFEQMWAQQSTHRRGELEDHWASASNEADTTPA